MQKSKTISNFLGQNAAFPAFYSEPDRIRINMQTMAKLVARKS
jgi:hypothetical protein